MNHIINAFKNLPRRGQHNFVKILCLSLGLAISSVIIAEIYFEQTYDTYFPGWERTYLISEVGTNHGETMEFTNTSGATAQGVKQYAPMVEAATSTLYFMMMPNARWKTRTSFLPISGWQTVVSLMSFHRRY